MFHSFGLTAATLMPLFTGMKVVLYPSPLHYKEIPKLIGATRATVLFATDTFLQGYGRAAETGDLKTVRYVIAGAEKVKDQTRVHGANTGPQFLKVTAQRSARPSSHATDRSSHRAGSVGPFLSGIEFRLDPVPGITEGGRLLVKGPNVMSGYMFHDKPGVLVPNQRRLARYWRHRLRRQSRASL